MVENLSALEIASRYVTALAGQDFEGMNALRAPGFVLEFVYSDATESEPLSSEETKQFWPSWLGLASMRIITILPYRLQLLIGKIIGHSFYPTYAPLTC